MCLLASSEVSVKSSAHLKNWIVSLLLIVGVLYVFEFMSSVICWEYCFPIWGLNFFFLAVPFNNQ